MTVTDITVLRDARIRKWITDNATELIRQSPLGVTLGLLITGLRQMKNNDLKDVTEDQFYHRCSRGLSELVENGILRKQGKHYFYVEPSDRVIEGLEELIDHAFPGAKLKGKDLTQLRAALAGLEAVEKPATQKPRRSKMGSKVE